MQGSQKPNGTKTEFLKYPASEVQTPPQGAPPAWPGIPKADESPETYVTSKPASLDPSHSTGKTDILSLVDETGLLFAVNSPADLGTQSSVGPGLGFFPEQWPSIFLAPGTGFVQDNYSMDGGEGWFRDDSSALHLLHTLFLL